MNIKIYLKLLQKLIPNTWLEQIQRLHSSLILQWILPWLSKPLAFSQKSVMVFSPHQDDETFGCGGMIAMKRQHNISVAVVFLTDGSGSGISETYSPDTIIKVRQQEAATALQTLGVNSSDIYFLEKLDGSLKYLSHDERQQTIQQIVRLLKYHSPGEVYVPHYHDWHKDHEATYELVKEAIAQSKITVELLQYPVWLFWQTPLFILLKMQDIAGAYRLPITSVQEQKKQAIASYASQLPNLPRGFVNQFLRTDEIFFQAKL